MFLLFSWLGFTQAEASHWYFGNGAGLIFDISAGTVTPTADAASTINTIEGCSSISDVNGNLLFYTDGRNVWDKNHNIMPNADYASGTGLYGDPSSTSSGLIVPKPGNPNQYYIFTVDEPHHQNAYAFPNQGPANESGNPVNFYSDSNGGVPEADDGYNNGFAYSLVDLTLNGGNGDVFFSEKNVQLTTYDPTDQAQDSYKCSEKITAVEHADGQSYWVLTHFRDKFYAFRVDNSGVDTNPVVSTAGPLITEQGYRRNAIGYMKASPDGSKIVICHRQNGNTQGSNSNNTGSVWLYNFDNSTGLISATNAVNLYPNSGPYGVEFSPDSSKVYVTADNSVVQFDISNPAPASTLTTVYNGFNFIGAIQLGPDGKIYVANSANPQTLDVINSPDDLGIACDYDTNGQALATGTFSNIGLPPFIQSFFLASIVVENSCEGQDSQFNINTSQAYDSIAWDFGDGTGTSDLENPIYNYATAGVYTVTAEITIGTEVNIFTQEITISNTPTANAVDDLLECDDDDDGVLSFDFIDIQNQLIGTQDPTAFTVSYHTSLAEAENGDNPLDIPYQNTAATEEIFIRIENNANTNCYDTTSFNLTVFDTPLANTVDTVEVCDTLDDGDDANGQIELTLTDFDATVLGTQDNSLFDISYHLSQDDADSNSNPISSPYYNTTAFSYQVFVRIENNLNTNCYDTSNFTVNVNPVPIALNTTLIQCDEDGINDGLTTFNLSEANAELTNGVAGLSTKFFLSLIDAENSAGEISAFPFTNTQNPQIVYAQVINDITGCFDISQISLEVSLTSGTDAVLASCDDDGVEDGFYVFTLSDATSTILSGLSSDYNLVYYETYDDALVEQNPLSNTFTNTSAYNQTIYARIENNNQCYGVNSLELVVYELPQLLDDDQTFFCIDSNSDPVTLDSGIIGNPNDYSFQWSSGQDTAEIEIIQGGTYTVTVTNINNCSQSKSITVVNSNIATIDQVIVNDVSTNNTVTVLASGEGDYEYALDDEFGPYQDNTTFFNVSPGFHTVYVRDKNGCGIASQLISVIGFPNFFTPNDDGYNDTWHVYGINTPEQAESEIYIFDRYGKLIKQLLYNSEGWDGTYNGNRMPTSDYWFYIKLSDNRIFRGHFTLKR
ncbi:MAG: T9SS type B sorting domain-containing protein [Flavobacteriaceae bacterium]